MRPDPFFTHPADPAFRSRERVAVVLSHPVQYYSPWFRWIVAHTGLQLRVFYLWDNGGAARHDPDFQRAIEWDVDLLSGYEHEFVPNVSSRPGSDRFFGLINPGLYPRLSRWAPDAVLLFGYNYATHVGVLGWSWLTRTPLIFRGDSHRLGREIPSTRARLVLGVLYKFFSAHLAVGKANRNYFKIFGVPAAKIFFAPHAVDRGRFQRSESVLAEAAKIRASLGLGGKTHVLLFAGKLSPGKQPVELLSAFLSLRRPNWALVFVGSGAEKPRLRALAAQQLDVQVLFLPFANQSEMAARYALADLFALPSRGFYETWGLAVNEAMHLGVPALVSDRVGCQRDLVDDGTTGWVFRAGEPGALQEKLRAACTAAESPAAATVLRAAVLERISHYSYVAATTGLMRALAYVRRETRRETFPFKNAV